MGRLSRWSLGTRSLLSTGFIVFAVGLALACDSGLPDQVGSPTPSGSPDASAPTQSPAGPGVPPTRSPLAPGAQTTPGPALPAGDVRGVQATGETAPVPGRGDAADDPAIWVHPTDAALSTIIATDKEDGGIAVYNLDGSQLQYLPLGEVTNVDLRGDFRLGGENVTLVAASNRAKEVISVFKVDLQSRQLVELTTNAHSPNIDIYSLCMYRSPATSKYYVFISEEDGTNIQQWELSDAANGGVNLLHVRTVRSNGQVEGCVADDFKAQVYLADARTGIWLFGAEPGDGARGTLIDTLVGGRLNSVVDGLTIYYASRDDGYLIASSQGNDTYVVYDRRTQAYSGTFRIDDGAVDGVDSSAGIDVTNRGLGSRFPTGLFVAHDGTNPGGNQNFKLVPWEAIANAFSPPLRIQIALVN